jgi:hypothetical protein
MNDSFELFCLRCPVYARLLAGVIIWAVSTTVTIITLMGALFLFGVLRLSPDVSGGAIFITATLVIVFFPVFSIIGSDSLIENMQKQAETGACWVLEESEGGWILRHKRG